MQKRRKEKKAQAACPFVDSTLFYALFYVSLFLSLSVLLGAIPIHSVSSCGINWVTARFIIPPRESVRDVDYAFASRNTFFSPVIFLFDIFFLLLLSIALFSFLVGCDRVSKMAGYVTYPLIVLPKWGYIPCNSFSLSLFLSLSYFFPSFLASFACRVQLVECSFAVMV